MTNLNIVQYTRHNSSNPLLQKVYQQNTPLKEKENECNWLLEDYNYDLWKSECGMDWYMSNPEGPINNQMNFCPNCGREITVVN